MKRNIILGIFIFMFVGILTCSSCKYIVDDRASKGEIFSFVRENQEKIINFPFDEYWKLHEEKQDSFLSQYFEMESFVKYVLLTNVLYFQCGSVSYGMEEATEVGFYYSENNEARVVCFHDYTPKLEQTEPGVYEWESASGRKKYITEKITDNIFYYSYYSRANFNEYIFD